MILNQNKNHDFDFQNHDLIFKIKIMPISELGHIENWEAETTGHRQLGHTESILKLSSQIRIRRLSCYLLGNYLQHGTVMKCFRLQSRKDL